MGYPVRSEIRQPGMRVRVLPEFSCLVICYTTTKRVTLLWVRLGLGEQPFSQDRHIASCICQYLAFLKNTLYFCSNSSHHASHRTANQGGAFAFYTYEIFKTTIRLSRNHRFIKISWTYCHRHGQGVQNPTKSCREKSWILNTLPNWVTKSQNSRQIR